MDTRVFRGGAVFLEVVDSGNPFGWEGRIPCVFGWVVPRPGPHGPARAPPRLRNSSRLAGRKLFEARRNDWNQEA